MFDSYLRNVTPGTKSFVTEKKPGSGGNPLHFASAPAQQASRTATTRGTVRLEISERSATVHHECSTRKGWMARLSDRHGRIANSSSFSRSSVIHDARRESVGTPSRWDKAEGIGCVTPSAHQSTRAERPNSTTVEGTVQNFTLLGVKKMPLLL